MDGNVVNLPQVRNAAARQQGAPSVKPDLLKRLSEAHAAVYHPENTASSPDKLKMLHSLVGEVIADQSINIGGDIVMSDLANRIEAKGIAPPDGLELIADIEGIGCCTVVIRNGRVNIAAETVRDIINIGIAPPDGMVLVPLSEFPLFDDNGLDEVAHHCEWSMQQDRKRIHACAAAPKVVSE